MAQKRRVFQIAEKIRNLIALELINAADPRFFMVTVTSVLVSADLRQAKVYWVVSGDVERRKEVQEAFDSAAGLFKRSLAHELGVKFVPELKFFYDDTFDASTEVEQLFARVKQADKQRAAEAQVVPSVGRSESESKDRG